MMTEEDVSKLFFEGHGATLQDRVRRAIAADINSGKYLPGDQLPAEKDICVALGVSLSPVRGALEQLAQRGVVVRRQGKGTFVRDKRVQYRLESWQSCTDDLRNQGISFTTRVLTLADSVAPEEIRTALALSKGEEAFHLTRLIVVHGRPAIILDSWTRGVSAESIGGDVDFEAGDSLYRALSRLGIRLMSADTAIEIAFAGEPESALLDVSYATPLLQVTGVAMSTDGPREWSRLKYLGEAFSLNMRREITTQPASEVMTNEKKEVNQE